MSQFKRALFATSYFGKSYAFSGKYASRVVDAGEPFSGYIDLKIKAILPEINYYPTTDSWSYVRADWVKQSDDSIRTTKSNAEATFFACGDKFDLLFMSGTEYGSATITIRNDETGTEEVFTIDTATTASWSYGGSYANYFITVKSNSALPIRIRKMTTRIASIKANARTADVSHTEQNPYSLPNEYPIVFPNGLTPDNEGFIIARTENEVINQRFVSLELILATSDSDPATSPVVDAIEVSSGDLTEYAEDGYWYAAINLHNVAQQAGKTFRRAKRVDITVPEPTDPGLLSDPNWWDSYLAIRSTSKVVSSSSTAIPSDADTRNPSYWKAESATYRNYSGSPINRMSLGQASNGSFVQTQTLGAAVYGPYSAQAAGYAYTKITKWLEAYNVYSSFPTVYKQTSIVIQLFDNKDVSKYLPIWEYELRQGDNPTLIPFQLSQAYPELYLRLLFRSSPGQQTPVFDGLEFNYDMHFNRTLAYPTNSVSGLDGPIANPNGKKLLKQITPVSNFQLPSNATNHNYSLDYRAVYPNEQLIFFGNSSGNANYGNRRNGISTLYIHSHVSPKQPIASTKVASAGTLYWHYLYDGGTVLFPLTATREVGTDFTPSLRKSRKYRFKLLSGWKDETFTLPRNMTWLEISDILSISVQDLKNKNKSVVEYSGFIPEGTSLLLPNYTKNENVQLVFSSTKNHLTEKSIWNGQTSNEKVEAVVSGDMFEAVDWTSEERFFTGILNPNNEPKSYIRTQNLRAGSNPSPREITHSSITPITYTQIAKQNLIELDDLLIANFGTATINEEIVVSQGEKYLLPAVPSLPEIPPEVWFDGNNPYKVEVVSQTVRRTADNLLLKDTIVTPGSDDEDAITFTVRPSLAKTESLTRGEYANGTDSLSFSNVLSVSRIVNNSSGVVYVPYSKVGNSENGDYILKGNSIDWSPSHSGSKEPAAGDTYTVTFIHATIDTLRILYSSSYNERAAFDKLWRSKEVKLVNQVVGPGEDILLDLPIADSYSDKPFDLRNIGYVVEDDDLWVKSSVVEKDGQKKLLLTLNGKDPKRNWHPTIETGFYYLNDEEHYLYSEPITHEFKEESIPILENISYNDNGLRLSSI